MESSPEPYILNQTHKITTTFEENIEVTRST